MALCLGIVAVVGFLGLSDRLRNFRFYFLPVRSVSGRVVCRQLLFGVLISALSVMAWISSDIAAGQHFSSNLYSSLERDYHVRVQPRAWWRFWPESEPCTRIGKSGGVGELPR